MKLKYFRILIAVEDNANLQDIRDLVSHFDGDTEYETTEGKVMIPFVEEITEDIHYRPPSVS